MYRGGRGMRDFRMTLIINKYSHHFLKKSWKRRLTKLLQSKSLIVTLSGNAWSSWPRNWFQTFIEGCFSISLLSLLQKIKSAFRINNLKNVLGRLQVTKQPGWQSDIVWRFYGLKSESCDSRSVLNRCYLICIQTSCEFRFVVNYKAIWHMFDAMLFLDRKIIHVQS